MTILILFASLWGLFQLLFLLTPSRSIRWRAVLLSFLTGVYLCAIIALLVQQLWIRNYADYVHESIREITGIAAYTVDPFLEEAIKILPIFLIALFPRVRRQLGVADMLLIGASLGAGFGFMETTMKVLHSTKYAACNTMLSECNIAIGFSSSYIPGILNSLTSWIPCPYGPGGFFGSPTVNFLGQEIELAAYNQHLIWSAIAGFGLGLLFRLPHKWLRWLSLLFILWVSMDHAVYNLMVSDNGITGATAPLLFIPALGGFGRLPPLYLLLFGLIAICIDRYQNSRALKEEDDLRLSAEKKPALGILGTLESLLTTLLTKPFSLQKTWDYLFHRRAFAFLKYKQPTNASVDDIRRQLHAKRVMIENHPAGFSPVKWFKVLLVALQNHRICFLLIVQSILVILSLVPTIGYLVLGVFPGTKSIQEFFSQPPIPQIILAITLLGLTWSVFKIIAFYRFLPFTYRRGNSDVFIPYLLYGLVLQGALILGVTGLFLLSKGAPSQLLMDALHISGAAGEITILDIIFITLTVISIIGIFIEFPITLQFIFITLSWMQDYKTLLDALREKEFRDPDNVEILEVMIALFDIVAPFIGKSFLARSLMAIIYSGDLGNQGADIINIYFPDDRPTTISAVDKKLASTYTTLQSIKKGDAYLAEGKPEAALAEYEKARLQAGDPITKSIAFLREADAQQAAGDISGAMESLKQAKSVLQQAGADKVTLDYVDTRMQDLSRMGK